MHCVETTTGERTFSPLDGEKIELAEFGMGVFVAGKRSRFSRMGWVLVVGGGCFDDVNSRLVIDGAEHGNEISIGPFANQAKRMYRLMA